MGCEMVEAVTGRAGLDALRDWTPDCVIVDQDLSDIPGSDVMKTIAASVTPHPPVIVVSANLSVRDAVRAMKAGAKDAIEKPVDADQLKRVVSEAVNGSDLAQDVASVQLDLAGALPNRMTILVSAQRAACRPMGGGVLVPELDVLTMVPTDGGGAWTLPVDLDAGLEPGTTLYFQTWWFDATAIGGRAGSNAVSVTLPYGN